MRRRPRDFGALSFVLLTAAALAGCTVGPDFKTPKLDLPAQFSERVATSTSLSPAQLAQWWKSFNDPILDRLIDDAIAGNIDLQVARQRLISAREARVQAGAAALPTFDFGAQAQQARASTTVEYPPGFGSYHSYTTGFDASWELDIFGGNRRATEAAGYGVDASLADRRALLVSLLSEVAQDYALLRSAQGELVIAQANVDTAGKALSYAERLNSRGLGTTLAIAEAKAELENSKAQLPAIQVKARVATHALAVLLGRMPEDFTIDAADAQPLAIGSDTIPDAVPAEVIENRSDVHAALMRYAQANAQIGVATAAKLPHFSIPMMLAPQASSIGDLFRGASLAYSLALQGTQSVYAGGKMNSRIHQANATAEAARLQYRGTVLSALQQVEDGLVRIQAQQQTRASLQASLEAAQSAHDQSARLYKAGLNDFLTVLTNERTVLAARRQVVENDLALVSDYIALYKAFGGGWQEVDLDPPPAATQPATPPGR